jgi:Ca2+-binding RTX toxin-like protein
MLGSDGLTGSGNALANTLIGNSGNNWLSGREGADVMIGGAGRDVYIVDNSGDTVVENADGGDDDVVMVSTHYRMPENVEVMMVQSFDDVQLYGNAQANTIYGNATNNLLDGGADADLLRGGFGDDVYIVDNAGDAVQESPTGGTDAIFSFVDRSLDLFVEALVLQGFANLKGNGNELANSIFGNSGDNLLDGRSGADVLTGNAGNDTFVFSVGQGNGDTVVDFAGNGAAAGDALMFVGYGPGATFTNVDATHWQVNYRGGSSHDVITFMNGATVDASDVVFV